MSNLLVRVMRMPVRAHFLHRGWGSENYEVYLFHDIAGEDFFGSVNNDGTIDYQRRAQQKTKPLLVLNKEETRAFVQSILNLGEASYRDDGRVNKVWIQEFPRKLRRRSRKHVV